MKRNNLFGVWLRCPRCGTIFAERDELREHLLTHPATAPAAIPDESEPDDEPQIQVPATARGMSWTPRAYNRAPR